MRQSSTDKRHFITVSVLVLIGTAVMFWLLDSALPMPIQASIQAQTVDQVFQWTLIAIAFLFSLVVVFMLYTVIVFRRRRGDTGEGEHFEGNTALEIIWTVVPLLLVVLFGYIGVTTLTDITKAQENEIVVQVEGFQWSWLFTYPTDSGEFTSTELVLPVNQPARMEMSSRDVNHSFWIVEMRVKQDLLPGQTTVLRLTPTIEGDYKLRCAELCGLSHWQMLADVRIVSPEEYDAWLAQQSSQAAAVTTASN